MKNTYRFALVAGLVAIFAAATVPVLMAQNGPPQGPPMGRHAGPPPDGRMGPRGPMGILGPALRALNLTDEQREQVKGIMQSHRADFKQVGDKIRAARDGMGALVDADTLDEAAIRAKSLEVASAEADAAILNARVRAEVYALLTPEQLDKAKELKDAMKYRRQQMGDKMRQRGPGDPRGH
jgi:periplasmic protein CpxP/Spy